MKVTQAAQGLLDALAANTIEAVHRILGASVSAAAPDVASSCAVFDQRLVVSESQHSSAIRNGADLAQQGIGHPVQRHIKPSRSLDPQCACEAYFFTANTPHVPLQVKIALSIFHADAEDTGEASCEDQPQV